MYRSIVFILLGGLTCIHLFAAEHGYQENFDNIPVKQLPPDWRVAATHPGGTLAHWQVEADNPARIQNKFLSLNQVNVRSRGVFNLCWTDRVKFHEGELTVRIRANQGAVDQGGGLIWRVRDTNNYYLARYNPLENNFRLYHVVKGYRSQLASMEKLSVTTGQWFVLRIAHHGQRIQGWLNNQLAWEIMDDTLPGTGGIGLWTKADAASSFDDLVVTHSADGS